MNREQIAIFAAVEDGVSRALRSRVEALGYRVAPTMPLDSFQEAELAAADLALALIAVPHDGLDAARALRQRLDIPALLVALDGTPPHEDEGLPQDCSPRELDLAIRLALEKGRSAELSAKLQESDNSREELRHAMDVGRAGVWELDYGSGKITWSDGTFRLFGYVPGEVEPSTEAWLNAVHPDDRMRMLGVRQAAIGEGTGFSSEFRILRSSGEIVWLQSLGQMIRDHSGEITGMLGFQTDITAQKRMECALRESEERYRLLFEHAPIGISLSDPETFKMRHANRAMCRMLGYPDNGLIGLSFVDLTHPEDLEFSMVNFSRLVNNEVPSYQVEKRYLKKDGGILWGSLTVTKVRNASGESTFLAMLEDVSERKLALERQLEQAATQRNTLIREVHHRIKNNLQSVAGLLGRELSPYPELHPRLAVATSQVNAIATIHGLQSDRRREAVLLCEALEHICRAIAEQTGRRVDCRIDRTDPAFHAVQIVEEEAVAIALILNELIFNAVKHTPPGASDPIVSMTSDGVTAQVHVGNVATFGGDFDFATGRGFNTGLKLLSSLLPSEGASLRYDGVGGDRVLAMLELTVPAVVGMPELGP